MDRGSVVHLANMNYLCEATVGQWVCVPVGVLSHFMQPSGQCLKHLNITQSVVPDVRVPGWLWFFSSTSGIAPLRALFHLEAKYCLILWLNVHGR